MKLTPLLVILPILAACASGPQGGPPRGGGGGQGGPQGAEFQMPRQIAAPIGLFFVGMDRDGDGLTSRQEAETIVPQLFGYADTDSSGALRPIEFSVFAERFFGTDDAAIGVSSFDRNMDDSVSEKEFSGYVLWRFDKIDANGDGLLQRSELLERFEPRSRGGGRNGRGGGGRGGGGRG